MKARSTIVFIIVSAVLGLIAYSVPVVQEFVYIDEITGSTKSERRWFFAFTSTYTQPSVLKTWTTRNGRSYAEHWRYSNDTMFSVFGTRLVQASGGVPEIVELTHPSEICDQFIHASTDQEIEDLLNVMQVGTHAQKDIAVKNAVKKSFTAMGLSEVAK